jgi:hypothetical protein
MHVAQLGKPLRWKRFFRIPEAGELAGLSRAEAYRQAARFRKSGGREGMPNTMLTRGISGVPKGIWLRIVKAAKAR